MANATASEFALFQKLANPAKTDFSRRRRPPTGSSFGSVVASHVGGGGQDKQSTFSTRSTRSATHHASSDARSHHSVRPKSTVSQHSVRPKSTTSHHSHGGRLSDTDDDDDDDDEAVEEEHGHIQNEDEPHRSFLPGPSPMLAGASAHAAFGGMPPGFEPWSGDGGGSGGGASEGGVSDDLNAEIDREKQGYLLELSKFREQGVVLTREYSMRDSLEEIQFEYDRVRMNLDTTNAVGFMRDSMFLGFQGIELANNKWGPVLQLDGWSKSATKDKQRYNHALERLYKQYWRRGNTSPGMELGWLIGSSMFMQHFTNKWGGGSSRSNKKKKQHNGGDDSDSDDDENTSSGGGGGGGGPLNLVAMMGGGGAGGILSGLMGGAGAGAGGGSTRSSLPTMRRPLSAMPNVNNTGRPIMRGPNTAGLGGAPTEPQVVPSDSGPSTIRMHRFHGSAPSMPQMPNMPPTGPYRNNDSGVISGTVHAPVSVPDSLHSEMHDQKLKSMERAMAHKDEELHRIRQEMVAQQRQMNQSMVEMRNMMMQQQKHHQQQPQHLHAHPQHQQSQQSQKAHVTAAVFQHQLHVGGSTMPGVRFGAVVTGSGPSASLQRDSHGHGPHVEQLSSDDDGLDEAEKDEDLDGKDEDLDGKDEDLDGKDEDVDEEDAKTCSPESSGGGGADDNDNESDREDEAVHVEQDESGGDNSEDGCGVRNIDISDHKARGRRRATTPVASTAKKAAAISLTLE